MKIQIKRKIKIRKRKKNIKSNLNKRNDIRFLFVFYNFFIKIKLNEQNIFF